MFHSKHRVCTPGVASRYHTDIHRSGTGGSNGNYWSGYIVTNGNGPYGFDEVSADWYVPTWSGTSNSQRALQWVGIGGYGTPYLWQAGTETDHNVGYRFWYEDVPNDNIIYAGPDVSGGNFVTVYVDFNLSIKNESFLYMLNNTTNGYWSTQKSFTPDLNSAEWIVERTSCGANKNYALERTSAVNWSDANASNIYYGNLEEVITYYPDVILANMYQNGLDLSDNSSIGSQGTSFTTYYHNSGVSYC